MIDLERVYRGGGPISICIPDGKEREAYRRELHLRFGKLLLAHRDVRLRLCTRLRRTWALDVWTEPNTGRRRRGRPSRQTLKP